MNQYPQTVPLYKPNEIIQITYLHWQNDKQNSKMETTQHKRAKQLPKLQPTRPDKTLTPSCAMKNKEEKKMLRYAKMKDAISAPGKNTTPHW